MTLDELEQIIDESSLDDWHQVSAKVVADWDYGTDRGKRYLEPRSHNYLAVYKPDIDISIAYGASDGEKFQEPWTAKFPDHSATAVDVWIRYRGVVVRDHRFAYVDGFRYLLPMPDRDGDDFVVPRSELPLARLMFNLKGADNSNSTLDSTLNRAVIKVV